MSEKIHLYFRFLSTIWLTSSNLQRKFIWNSKWSFYIKTVFEETLLWLSKLKWIQTFWDRYNKISLILNSHLNFLKICHFNTCRLSNLDTCCQTNSFKFTMWSYHVLTLSPGYRGLPWLSLKTSRNSLPLDWSTP